MRETSFLKITQPGSHRTVGVAHSEVNPNTRVMNSRGIWLAYIILVGLLHVVLLSIPFFSIPVVWTLTNVIHNLVSTKPCPFTHPRLFPTKNNYRLSSHGSWASLLLGLEDLPRPGIEPRLLHWQESLYHCVPHGSPLAHSTWSR